jgi:hypothetical protein
LKPQKFQVGAAESTPAQTAAARLTVAAHAVDAADLRDLLEMTGLMPSGGGARECCGSPGGWRLHQREGEPQCAACRRAWAAYQRELRQGTRGGSS